ncbi:MAG TPA: membrane protein insertase YidC [Ferruginibacter sp.]|nr:membrane protein insertase YidC [Ferruginibacter sp.]
MGSGFDRNTVIGFVLIGILMTGMFYFNSKSNNEYLAQQKHIADSIAALQPKVDTAAQRLDSIKFSDEKKQEAGALFQQAGAEQLTTVENSVLKITFTNKGGQPKRVELKDPKYTFNRKQVVLQNGDSSKISYAVNSGDNQVAQTADLAFVTNPVVVNADKSQTISFTIKDSSGKEITHQYTIRPDDYMIDFSIIINGADRLLTQNTINLLWQVQTTQAEKDVSFEKTQLQIGQVEDGKYDFERTIKGDGDKKFDKPVDFLSVKQQFFITAIIDKDKFQNGEVTWSVPADSGRTLMQSVANLRATVPAGVTSTVPLQLYYGPSDFHILSKYGNDMYEIVPYGSGPFAFVKYINRYILLPVFDVIKNNVANMGIVILLLTLLIRLITSPILYKSYVSGAKMKALKPEIDRLKEKHGEDKQAFSMDQMKLWKSAGVSPLGGCLPAVLQIPIFMSLYYFFQSNIALRGQHFLWAKDLAAYDSIANLPFSIPFYGDHVSLFTLTATLTSLLISIYSMNTTMQDNSNPAMKYMPFIFPIFLLGIFNKLPAALTWYYTISNTITLVLQIVIQKYIINHDEILAQIEANKKKPIKQSKWQERLAEVQENSKKIQDAKKNNNKR